MIKLENIIKDMLLEGDNKLLYHGSGMDFNKFEPNVGDGTGVSHYGQGTYVIDDRATALEYIKQYARGMNGVLYTCKLFRMDTIVQWDEQIPMDIFMEMGEEIADSDSSLSSEMLEYPQSYRGETFTYGELYSQLEHVDEVDTNIFFMDYNIYGFSGGNRINPDATEYCILDNEMIKILEKENIKG